MRFRWDGYSKEEFETTVRQFVDELDWTDSDMLNRLSLNLCREFVDKINWIYFACNINSTYSFRAEKFRKEFINKVGIQNNV